MNKYCDNCKQTNKQAVELINSFTNANDTLNQCGKWKCLDNHLSLEC